ncbi:Zn-dependent hydrolase [Actinomadura violacea]|uniref:Zn-dependent hydrolase n=1 Tax=Actinomadura violacea TaxID=2819934 RepID=A0ABS3RPT2_9ACTN|nr:Zn-dependent hydrolase [Actinomadura violacea]MBO2458318.1 Zn-dependent hydrolase [Actinomadura violacea]
MDIDTDTAINLDTAVDIDAGRLLRDLDELARFGGRPDGGVDRVAGSPADLASRAWLADRLAEAGLAARTDAAGNVFGQVPGARPWLLAGSHTDTVPAGGRLDGAYGVIAALEVLRTLHEHGHPAAGALEVVSFWDEEGAGPASAGGLAGSTAMCAGDHVRDLRAYLELHIEQGPRMERDGLELAVVEGIVGIERHQVVMRGAANHAGTTPMDERADAGRAAAVVAAAVPDRVLGVDPAMVVNVGHIEFLPGAPNVVPGEARLVVEWRGARDDSLLRAEKELSALAHDTAEALGCQGEIRAVSRKPPAVFDPGLCDLVARACRAAGGPAGRMHSFAGHDAGVLSAHVPTAMIFVPSAGGVSHSPLEHTPEPMLARGCRALLAAVAEAAGRGPAGTGGTGGTARPPRGEE